TASLAGERDDAALDQAIERGPKLSGLRTNGFAQRGGRHIVATLRLERFEHFRIELLAARFGANVALGRATTTTTGLARRSGSSSGGGRPDGSRRRGLGGLGLARPTGTTTG